MPLKPLEKKENYLKSFLPKFVFLMFLISGGLLINVFANNLVKKTNDIPAVLGMEKKDTSTKSIGDLISQTQNSSAQVLGAATQFVSDTTSKSANMVSDFVYDNTFGRLVDQVKNLPKDQQERIKQEICK